jgi:hypothetical protein
MKLDLEGLGWKSIDWIYLAKVMDRWCSVMFYLKVM